MHRAQPCITPPRENPLPHIAFSTLPSVCKRECKMRAMSKARSATRKVLILQGFFATREASRPKRRGLALGRSPMPQMLRDGHRGSTPKPATPPYALAAHLESQKAFKIRPLSLLRFPLRAVQTLQRRLQNSRRVGNAIWRKSFSRQPAMHGHERCIEVHSVQGRPC